MATRVPITLTDDLDIFGIARRWEELINGIKAIDGDVVVDLSRVKDLDVSGMQLLMAVQATLTNRGSRATFLGLRPEFTQRMADLGLHLTEKEGQP